MVLMGGGGARELLKLREKQSEVENGLGHACLWDAVVRWGLLGRTVAVVVPVRVEHLAAERRRIHALSRGCSLP